jgi:phosphate starvation-inducible PhoH-like protein
MAKRPALHLVDGYSDDMQERAKRRRPSRTGRSGRPTVDNSAGPQGSLGQATQAYSKNLVAKSVGQQVLMNAIDNQDIVFAMGPAGAGKTKIAIAKAVDALKAGTVRRIILARPAVEAGERLGYMPGGLEEKLDPYMRPLYDALLESVAPQQLKAWMADRIVEIVPIGFMRGRTLANSFIVVDEAQNLTRGQMKMVLTRLGFGSTMVITGDPDQPDLDDGDSGLVDVAAQLEGRLDGCSVVRLGDSDVVRHPTVRAMLPLLMAA